MHLRSSKSDSELRMYSKKLLYRARKEISEVFIPDFPDVDLSYKQLCFDYDLYEVDAPEKAGSICIAESSEKEVISGLENTSLRYEDASLHEVDYRMGISGATYPEKFANKNIFADLYFQRWWDELGILENGYGSKTEEYYPQQAINNLAPNDNVEFKYPDIIVKSAIPRGCLFVAGYPVAMDDEDIVELLWIQFSRWGVVDNIKLTVTSNGIPYGFVYFQDYRSAEEFLLNSDRVYIRRSLLRVEDARVNRTLYVRHFEGSLNHKEYLLQEFKQNGDFVSLKYEEKVKICDQEGAWLVQFSNWNSAICAFESIQSSGFWYAEWGAQVGQVAQTIAYNLIYVDGLDSRVVDRKMIIVMFQQYGEIRSANLISRGSNSFSFIEFYNPLSSFRAVRCCHEMLWLGQTIRVQHYRRLSPRVGIMN